MDQLSRGQLVHKLSFSNRKRHVAFIKTLSSIPTADILVRGMAWVGGISAAIFVCHPITRKIFIPISRSGDILDVLVLYIVATIMLAMIFKKIIATLK